MGYPPQKLSSDRIDLHVAAHNITLFVNALVIKSMLNPVEWSGAKDQAVWSRFLLSLPANPSFARHSMFSLRSLQFLPYNLCDDGMQL